MPICYIRLLLFVIIFGLRPSPASWGIISTSIMQFPSVHVPANSMPEGTEAYIAFQYVADGTFIEPWLGLRPWKSLSLWERGLGKCLCPSVAHKAKRAIEGNSSTNISFWCIDASTETDAFSHPTGKLRRPSYFCGRLISIRASLESH